MKRWSWLLVALVMPLSSPLGCGGDGCIRNSDCPSDQACRAGQCQLKELPGGEGGAGEEPAGVSGSTRGGTAGRAAAGGGGAASAGRSGGGAAGDPSANGGAPAAEGGAAGAAGASESGAGAPSDATPDLSSAGEPTL